MKLVFLDAKTMGDDLDFSMLEEFGELICYDYSTKEEARERALDADILIVNKVPVNEYTIGDAKNLKLVCVAATGTNNLDKDYLDQRGIVWRNVAGYSTDSVAQHTFALLFYLYEKLPYYDAFVKNGEYERSQSFSHFAKIFYELSGKTWGIIGLGAIGRRVADIAKAFGCKVIYYSASGAPSQDGYEQVDFDTLLGTSDIVSIHAPLNEYTEGLMNEEAFKKMKPSAILINVGRGPIVDERALAHALNTNEIYAAGLDVLSEEPIRADNPLKEVKDKGRLLITPHMAWATKEARTRVLTLMAGHIKDYFS